MTWIFDTYGGKSTSGPRPRFALDWCWVLSLDPSISCQRKTLCSWKLMKTQSASLGPNMTSLAFGKSPITSLTISSTVLMSKSVHAQAEF
uniref:Uncharacterized protein n=1 Tax=Anguilla anguilla TaxID=7936 RepID=A0A0E9WHD4_ANGAN